MTSGVVDGSVRDRERGEIILSRLKWAIGKGSFIRVSATLIKVDRRPFLRYAVAEGEPGEEPDFVTGEGS